VTDAHSTRAHARLAPSSAYRWLKCAGSIALSEGLTEAPSEFADEGTAAHQLAERCLLGGTDAKKYRGDKIMVGARSFTVDAEMVDAVQLYLDVVREIAEEAEEFEVEQRLDVSDLVPGCFGTGDTVAYSEVTRRLSVVDLKYGKGVAVEVTENTQELTYALGLLKRYHNRGVDEVELVIVQPRAPHRDGPVRRWSTSVVGLYEHAIALQDAARSIAEPNAPRIPGGHCKFCKAAAICPELRGRVYEITGAERMAIGVLVVDAVEAYDAKLLAQAWRDRELVMGWCKSVEKFAHAEAMAGKKLPGLKLVRKDKHRAWKDEADAVGVLQVVYGLDHDDLFERKMRSPAQIEKELPKEARKAAMETLAEKPKTAETVLAELDDPRPAVDPGVASGFEVVEIGENS
jgi:hypothetical protein